MKLCRLGCAEGPMVRQHGEICGAAGARRGPLTYRSYAVVGKRFEVRSLELLSSMKYESVLCGA